MIEVFVDKIWSYQTLVYKNGKRTFKKKQYAYYELEISSQIKELKDITHKRPIEVKLTFKSTTKAIGDVDNIAKPVMDVLERHNKISNDRYVCKLTVEKKFRYDQNSIEIEIEER